MWGLSAGRMGEGEGTGSPLQCSCLENPMDRGACWATVYGVTRVGHDLATKPPPPPPGWERQPAVTKLGMSLQGGAWRRQKEEHSERDAEIQMQVVGRAQTGRRPLFCPLSREVCLFSGRKVRAPLTAPLFCVKSRAEHLLQRDGRMDGGLSGGDWTLHREGTLPASLTHLWSKSS